MLYVLRQASMEQHPVPQHIASYEFRLVGDMTLKQFGYLASGVVVGLIFYASSLPFYVKWPVIVFFGVLGVALAFVPIEERPLNQWIIAFVKAIFNPTQFIWRKRAVPPEIFKPTPAKITPQKTPAAPGDQKQLSEYLATLPSSQIKSPLEQREENFLNQVSNLFQLTKIPVSSSTFIGAKQAEGPIAPREEPVQPPIRPRGPVVLPEKPGQLRKPAVEAKTSQKLPIPAPSTRPNILVGMLLDQNGELVEGAILEIRNSQGIPVRALKTNKLGQFQIATSLDNDIYEIEVEKEGLSFDIIKIEAKGEIIQPLEIRARAQIEN